VSVGSPEATLNLSLVKLLIASISWTFLYPIDSEAMMHYLVAFTSREESQQTVAFAESLAASSKAAITLVKLVADPHSVGVVAELIATDDPSQYANDEVHQVVQELTQREIKANAIVRTVDDVGKGLVEIASEISADMIFVGTHEIGKAYDLLPKADPIADYVVSHCPINVVLVRP